MRRTGFALLLVLLAAFGATALDYGGNFDNLAGYAGDEAEGERLEETARISLWIDEMPADTLLFEAQLSYAYSLDRPLLFDADKLSLNGRFLMEGRMLTAVGFDVGRFAAEDPSGYVFSHNLDGLRIELYAPNVYVNLLGGYTGFVAKGNSNITMTEGDSKDRDDDDVYFAPARLLASAELGFPELAARQTLTLIYIGQFDLRPTGDLAAEGDTDQTLGGGRLSTHYPGLHLSGPIAAGLYHDLFGFVSIGDSLSYRLDSGQFASSRLFGYIAGCGVRWYAPALLSSAASLRFVYASGDEDAAGSIDGNQSGKATAFVPVSTTGFGLVFNPQLTNLAYGELSYSLKPFSGASAFRTEQLQTLLKAGLFFRTTLGTLSEPGFLPASGSYYLGSEVDLVVNVRPFSDLGFSVAAGAFLPASKTFARDAEAGAQVTVSLRF